MCRKLIYSFSIVLVLTGAARAELIGWWKFDEGSGTTAYDSSGNGNDGTLIGNPQWVAGKIGGALDFNGTDSIIDIPYSPDMTPSEGTTMSAWVFPTDTSRACIVGQFEGYGMALNTDLQLKSVVWGADWILSDVTIPTQEWSHIAMTWDVTNGERMIFLNGELVGQRPDSAVPQVQNNLGIGLWIGWPAAWGDDSFTGIIDDVQVHNIVLTEDEIVVIMKGEGYPYAVGPKPKDGDLYMDTWVNLSWSPGDYAVSHDVYLGDNFDDVTDATVDSPVFQGNQTDTFLVAGFPGFAFPDGLAPGTTYYWRIDEVNDSEPNSPWKGNVWSFSVPPKTAYNPDPADGAEFVDLNATFTWTPGFGARIHTVYFGDDFDEVAGATGGMPAGSASYSPAALEPEKVYYWRVDEFDAVETHKGDVWAFTTPGAVGNPQPANSAVDVQMIATLSWTAAETAASHELYFGSDAAAVGSATTASPEYVGPKALGAEGYDPGGLAWHSSYAWRVDEVYPTETVKGLVWTFTTADYIPVDDFESYNDIDPPDPNSNRIFDNWIDGFGTTTNGALVGNDLPPYAEQTIVHGGAQSMPYSYDNNLKTSEATLTLVYPRDWTAEGVTKLSVWFRGDSANSAERMFVALNGTALVYHDDASVTQMPGWNNWIIDLSRFADQGADLAIVNTITLGLGTKDSPSAGGSGKMYFDDIRLYR